MASLITGYKGEDLGLPALEGIALNRIPADLRVVELNLPTTAWFDYRLLHYVKRTYLLTHCYIERYQWFVATTSDYKRAPFVKSFKGEDVVDSRQFLPLVRLRQRLDVLGYRYDWFMAYAMRWFINRCWKRPPQPAQILGEEDFWFDVALAWSDANELELATANDPFYLAANWCDHTFQRDYEAYLIAKIQARPHPQYALANVLLQKRQLRPKVALAVFNESLMRAAMNYHRTTLPETQQ
jgi:hypothetical protein